MTAPSGPDRLPAARPRVRTDLDGLPFFRGRAAEPGMIGLDCNESPFAPPAAVQAALSGAVQGVNRYPDNSSADLTARLAERHGVPPATLCLGPGSVGLCAQLIQITCAAGDEVIVPWRSFEVYPAIAGTAGAVVRRVPLTAGHALDLPAMATAISDRTRLVFVCSPNNPTGTSVSRSVVERFLAEVPPDVLVVLDEAYAEFTEQEADPLDGFGLVRDLLRQGRTNVVALRTFSKAYGLAGLRIGYCLSAPPVAELLGRVAVPYAVGTLAQRAAVAALDCEREVRERCRHLTEERERVRAALLGAGWDVPVSGANFLWLPAGPAAEAFAAHCREQRILVKAFPGEGVRVTVGTATENDAFLAAAARFTPIEAGGAVRSAPLG
ncbi:histidinol-phosphate transaminase [Streptomyces sp. MH13]|uniref:histidinol-phosphate transaminase n=1 Tax=unclassified Streptomyces TaxID=2593676 RepID=UPI003CE79AE1